MALRVTTLTAALGCLSCSKSAAPETTIGKTAAPLIVPDVPSPAVATQPKAAPHLATVEAATALINEWQAVQNRQSFAEYESLYAERFHGVKRAGLVTTSFDRNGWLRDRNAMFVHPFRVGVEKLSVRQVADTAVAEFEQSFESKHYTDLGPKQVVMIVEQGKLKIAREELLNSERATGPKLASTDFSFVRDVGDHRYWVAGAANDGTTGVRVDAPPELVDTAAAFAKITDKSKLPASLQTLFGATVALEPGTQPPCTASLNNWGVLAQFDPHFATREHWASDNLADEEIAREIFGDDVASGVNQHFAVDITDATNSCESARWARLQSLGDVAHFDIEEVRESTLLTSLERRMRKTRSYKQLEERFREDDSDGTFEELIHEHLAVYRTRVGANTFLLSTFIYSDDCHGFSGEATWLWRMQGRSLIEMQSNIDWALTPELAFDLNRDGVPEWASDSQLMIWDGHTYTIEIDVLMGSYDCPC